MITTNQSIIITICGFIVLLIMIINIIKNKTINIVSKISMILVIICIITPLYILKIYSVNCMIDGNCVMLTWIFVILTMIFTFIYLFSFIYIILYPKKDKNENSKLNKDLLNENN